MTPRRLVTATAVDLTPLVADVEGVRSAVPPGWVNLMPRIVDGVEIPDTPGPLAIFSKRGPAVPVASWVMARGDHPDQIGLEHPVAAALKDRATEGLPAGLSVRQDHPRRGLVVDAAPTAGVLPTLTWLIALMFSVCPLPTTGDIDGFIFEPSR